MSNSKEIGNKSSFYLFLILMMIATILNGIKNNDPWSSRTNSTVLLALSMLIVSYFLPTDALEKVKSYLIIFMAISFGFLNYKNELINWRLNSLITKIKMEHNSVPGLEVTNRISTGTSTQLAPSVSHISPSPPPAFNRVEEGRTAKVHDKSVDVPVDCEPRDQEGGEEAPSLPSPHVTSVTDSMNEQSNESRTYYVPNYFTVGSTKDEVLSVQGTPSKLDVMEWGYGLSTVYFDRTGRVVRWSSYQSPGSRLKVRMVPTQPNWGSDGYFTVGSTKDEVLSVQGTPSKLDVMEWGYGLSTVYFDRTGRVVRWSSYQSPGSRLKVRMVPTQPNWGSDGYFTVGSTKDEVLSVQGTPTRLDVMEWGYGLSTVYFDRTGRVTRWNGYQSPGSRLKARM